MWLEQWARLAAKDAAALILPSLPHYTRLFCRVILAVPIFLSAQKCTQTILFYTEVKTIP